MATTGTFCVREYASTSGRDALHEVAADKRAGLPSARTVALVGRARCLLEALLQIDVGRAQGHVGRPHVGRNQLSVSFVVRDADREQVVGKLFVGDCEPVDVLRSGAQTLLLNVDQETAATRIIPGVSDSWNTIDYDLGPVPGR